ncbi:MAG: phosphotransferase [Gammaproteobacteria bacterium]|nr:phosphotransferase [Gammaproteobacteria bacterium]
MSEFYTLPRGEQAARFREMGVDALRRWGIEGAELSLIKLRENAVFRVESHGGNRCALRIHRHGYHSDAELNSELQWMRALDEAGVSVPEIIASESGALFESISHASVPEPRQVDLFRWIEGRQLGETGAALDAGAHGIRSTFHTIGELAARVHNQSAAWTPPPGFKRHAWDEDGLVGEQPFWGRFWELQSLTPSQRSLMERARAGVREDLIAFGKAPTAYGIIHADLTPENIMVHDERLRLIDFDDAGWGWHLFEIATALYFHLDQDYWENARDALIEGYRSLRPLSEEDVARLPLFLLARGLTYVGWVHTRSGTQTAEELGQVVVAMACRAAEEYLS